MMIHHSGYPFEALMVAQNTPSIRLGLSHTMKADPDPEFPCPVIGRPYITPYAGAGGVRGGCLKLSLPARPRIAGRVPIDQLSSQCAAGHTCGSCPTIGHSRSPTCPTPSILVQAFPRPSRHPPAMEPWDPGIPRSCHCSSPPPKSSPAPVLQESTNDIYPIGKGKTTSAWLTPCKASHRDRSVTAVGWI